MYIVVVDQWCSHWLIGLQTGDPSNWCFTTTRAITDIFPHTHNPLAEHLEHDYLLRAPTKKILMHLRKNSTTLYGRVHERQETM